MKRVHKRKPCVDCGELTTKTRCKPCGYKNRVVPIWNKGLKGIHLSAATEFKSRDSVWVDYKGYQQKWVNGRSMRVHRLVMEQHLGRTLEIDEVIHHINGDKLDNRLSNLRLMTKPAHDKLHNGKSIKVTQNV